MTKCIETWRNLPEVKTVLGNLARTCSAAPNFPAHIEQSRVWEQNPTVVPVWLSPRCCQRTRVNLTKPTFYSVSYLRVEEAAWGLLESLRWNAYTCLILSFEINFFVYLCVCAHAHLHGCCSQRAICTSQCSPTISCGCWGFAVSSFPHRTRWGFNLIIEMKWLKFTEEINYYPSKRHWTVFSVTVALLSGRNQSWKYHWSLRKVTKTSHLRVIGFGEILVTIATWLRKDFN